MTAYTVHLTMTVSTIVRVEADDPLEAINNAYDSDDMPRGITVGAFGQANVDESGEWEPIAVEDETGETVWPR